MKSWKCSMKQCKNYELLPAFCQQCSQLFCKDHENPKTHNCQNKIQCSKNISILKSKQKEQDSTKIHKVTMKNFQNIKQHKENNIDIVQKKLLQFEIEDEKEKEKESQLNKIGSEQVIKKIETNQSFNSKVKSSRNIDKLLHKPCFTNFVFEKDGH